MVKRRELIAIAVRAWRERGTAMAAAMLRALGLCPALIPAARSGSVPARPDLRFEGMDECMANRESPMDLIR